MIKVLFVCLGNICRSPLAEAVFNGLLRDKGLEKAISCDSAGTSDYHIGEAADVRTLEVVREKKLNLEHHARQFLSHDFSSFDYIIAMDESNLANIKTLGKDQKATYKLFMMREFDTDTSDTNVPDPYWGGDRGFFKVYNILYRSCQNFLDYLKKEHSL